MQRILLRVVGVWRVLDRCRSAQHARIGGTRTALNAAIPGYLCSAPQAKLLRLEFQRCSPGRAAPLVGQLMEDLPVMKFRVLKNNWVGFALCAGLVALPLAAHADAADEVSTAAQHAGFSAKATSLSVAHMHLHHTLNCLVGPGGRGFDAKQANPCSDKGSGAIPDTTDAAAKKTLERIASRTRRALASKDLATVQKDATTIQTELGNVK